MGCSPRRMRKSCTCACRTRSRKQRWRAIGNRACPAHRLSRRYRRRSQRRYVAWRATLDTNSQWTSAPRNHPSCGGLDRVRPSRAPGAAGVAAGRRRERRPPEFSLTERRPGSAFLMAAMADIDSASGGRRGRAACAIAAAHSARVVVRRWYPNGSCRRWDGISGSVGRVANRRRR